MELKHFKARVWNLYLKAYEDKPYEKIAIKQHEYCEDLCLSDEYYICLYSGFRDKNNNEIYEGDIFTYENRDYVLFIDKIFWMVINLETKEYFMIDNANNLNDVIIIGCMFDENERGIKARELIKGYDKGNHAAI